MDPNNILLTKRIPKPSQKVRDGSEGRKLKLASRQDKRKATDPETTTAVADDVAKFMMENTEPNRAALTSDEEESRDSHHNVAEVEQESQSKEVCADSTTETSEDEEFRTNPSFNSDRQRLLLQLMEDAKSSNAFEVCIGECEWGGAGQVHNDTLCDSNVKKLQSSPFSHNFQPFLCIALSHEKYRVTTNFSVFQAAVRLQRQRDECASGAVLVMVKTLNSSTIEQLSETDVWFFKAVGGLWTDSISRTIIDELLWVLDVLKTLASHYPRGGIGVITESIVSKCLRLDADSSHFYLSAKPSTRRNYVRIAKRMERAGVTGILSEILRVHPNPKRELQQTAVFACIDRIHEEIQFRPPVFSSKNRLQSFLDDIQEGKSVGFPKFKRKRSPESEIESVRIAMRTLHKRLKTLSRSRSGSQYTEINAKSMRLFNELNSSIESYDHAVTE